MTVTGELLYLLRIFAALLLGFAIGLERKMRYKEAGIRTHAIVSAGSCLIMIISKYGFTDVVGADGARIAAQIVSGIGFLGAGIIMYRQDSLRGVTTAAGIWATAGIGMAVGTGMYIVAMGASALIIGLQCVLHIRVAFFQAKRFYIYRIKFNCEDKENEKLKSLFGVENYSRINYYNSKDGGVSASAEISTNRAVSDDEIKRIIIENAFITAIERIFQADGKE